mgnify:CR=1 FL=1
MEKHFVVFYSPGTFVSESTEKEIEKWDVNKASQMSREIKERHGAKPYGFKFFTKESDGWEPKVVKTSGMYFLGGKIMSYDDIPNNEENKILKSNMKNNGWDYVIENTNSWKVTLPFEKNDILLSDEL